MFNFTRKQLVKAGTALTMIMIMALMLVSTASAGSFGYADFSSTAGLTLVDNAAQAGSRLRLVPAATGQRGAAWTDTKQCVANGFDTTFNFQISNQLSGGADGIAFVVQNNSGSAIGGYGGGIGYHNLTNSLAVEFDTWYNGGPDEPNGNHISVRSQGTGANLAIGVPSLGTTAAGLPNFAGDGAVHTARINYTPGSMDVYLDNVLRLNVAVDLESLLSLDNGNAYVGFTSATGSAAENEDILSWAYSANCAPVADANGPYLVALNSSIVLDGSGSYDPDGDPISYNWSVSSGSLDDATLVQPTYTPSEVGIHTASLTVEDSNGLTDSDSTTIVVYDPEGGFVTGGGWFDSPPGAFHPVEIVNGSFETGDYSGWTLWEGGASNSPSSGTWGIAQDGQVANAGDLLFDYFDGVYNPVFTPGVPIIFEASEGNYVAFNLQTGPQSHRLYQDFAIPDGCNATLSWEMKYENHFPAFDPSNQYLAVHIRDTSDTIIETLYKTVEGIDPLAMPMTSFSRDLSAYNGSTVRLDAEIVVNEFYFDALAFDSFSVTCEPAGKANFGFVSKYQRGASTPTGQTEFQFKAGDLNFHSTRYDWLVIAGQDKAKYKGEGTINGEGNYGFMLTATDNGNSGDTFRIKIWDKDNGDAVVYDNQSSEDDDSYAGTVISGGNIKVHSGK